MKKYFKHAYILFICLLTIFSPFKVYANSISFNKGSITLNIGSSQTLQYTLGEGLDSNNIEWHSTDPTVATVNNGVITAVGEGSTIITASIDGYSTTCKVVVSSNYIKVTGIKLNKSSSSLLVGETETLKTTITPADASNKNVTWSSSDETVATVSSTGKITAKSIGTAIITASVDGYSATCKVTVSYSLSLKGISLNQTNINIKEKQTTQLSVIYNPQNATNKKVTWKSSNNAVVTVSSSGLVTAVSKGSATITVISNDGGYVATCKVTVEEISKKVTDIKLNKKEITLLAGKTETIIATIIPDYAENKKIIWTSSDERKATVENGKITAISPGTVEIKATTEDGNKEAICKVTITAAPLEKITFKEESQTIYIGDELKLNVITSPQGSVLENAIWISEEPSIATVENGKVMARSPGETIITVSSEDGKITASTKVIVIEKPKEKLNIKVEGYNLNFDPDKLNYTLKIGNEKELIIKTNVDSKDIIIKGNQNLTKGSIITITYSQNPDVTYVITIQKKQNYTIYFIAAISVLLLLNLIRILVKNKKKEKF